MESVVENVIQQRLRLIEVADPSLVLRWEMISNDWGIIEISHEGEVIGFEFIESLRSWAHPERFEMYAQTIKAGRYVIVAVPEEIYLIYMAKMSLMPLPRPLLFCYDRFGCMRNPRAS